MMCQAQVTCVSRHFRDADAAAEQKNEKLKRLQSEVPLLTQQNEELAEALQAARESEQRGQIELASSRAENGQLQEQLDGRQDETSSLRWQLEALQATAKTHARRCEVCMSSPCSVPCLRPQAGPRCVQAHSLPSSLWLAAIWGLHATNHIMRVHAMSGNSAPELLRRS